ncbi:MAG: hypothetical protein AAGG68_06695 [Bacteroidota bacterium]
MINNLAAIIILSLVLNSCCLVTSQDCGCVPPTPELSAEAISWIIPYDDKSNLIYESSNRSIDTFLVERTSEKEFCGGDECGANCNLETINLTSLNDSLDWSISASFNNRIEINPMADTVSEIYATWRTGDNNPFTSSEAIITSFDSQFQWDGRILSVIKIDCIDSVNCSSYKMKDMIISKEEGLIQYIDENDEVWNKKLN